MTYLLPSRLSPSRVDGFLSCPMAFRFSTIERLPEPPSPHAEKGSLVHRALELLFAEPAPARTPEAARSALAAATEELLASEVWPQLPLDETGREALLADAATMVERYLRMEDPSSVHAIGVELRLEVAVDELVLNGVIDRLDLVDGELVVTDYKTGRPPSLQYEQQKLAGVRFYAFLCQELFGRRPARVQLLFLSTGEVLSTTPTEQSTAFLPKRTRAVWSAMTLACRTGDFRPKPGPLCGSCAFQAWCPAFGGDPSLAATEAPARYALRAA